jgi:hypothetical protein
MKHLFAPIPSLGAEAPAIDRLALPFAEAIAHVPESITATTPAIGEVALDALAYRKQFGRGGMEWSQLLDAELEGDHLDRMVDLAVTIHRGLAKKEGAKTIAEDRLHRILPFVFKLTKHSLITAVGEIPRDETGRAFDTTPHALGSTSAATVRAQEYLLGGRDEADQAAAVARLGATRTLLHGTNAALRLQDPRDDRGRVLVHHDSSLAEAAEAYRDAITYNQVSPLFPDAEASTDDRKLAFADHARVEVAKALEGYYTTGLSGQQVKTFAHNILRPY